MNFSNNRTRKIIAFTIFPLLLGVVVNLCAQSPAKGKDDHSKRVNQDMISPDSKPDASLVNSDSVSLHVSKVAANLANFTYEKNDLYDSWNTSNVYADTKKPLPDSYTFDLRGVVMPTPSRNVTSHFGYRASFRRNHYGLDIKVYTGDTIVAPWDGKVRVVKNNPSGWGLYVVLRHRNGLETLYGHLSKQLVQTNQEVKAGQPIGLGGNTGRSTGSHLHLECRILGEAINPELLFDFPNQKMTCDFYNWRNTNYKRSSGKLLASNDSGDTSQQEAAGQSADVAATQAMADAGAAASSGSSSGSTGGGSKPAAPVKRGKQTQYHKVKNGDTLYGIARKYGVTVEELRKANKLNTKKSLRSGQVLKIVK